MGGRGSGSGKGGSSGGGNGTLNNNAKPVSLQNEKHMSSGGRWKHGIFEASDKGNGVIELSYATPTSYEHPNRNTTIANYSLKNGVWSGQTGDRDTHSVGINWSNVTAVQGKTYDVQNYLKNRGFKWNRKTRRYERDN